MSNESETLRRSGAFVKNSSAKLIFVLKNPAVNFYEIRNNGTKKRVLILRSN